MKALKRTGLALLLVLLAGTGLIGFRYTAGQAEAARFYAQSGNLKDDGVRIHLPAVPSVRITPVVEFYAADDPDSFTTDNAIAYIIEAGESRIIMDLGDTYDGREAESPLLHNLTLLGIGPGELDAAVISHPHEDHMGGKVRSLDGFDRLPVFVTMPEHQPAGSNVAVTGPQELLPGIGTTGPIPVGLLTGLVTEQAVVIRVADKGLLLVLGCGHPSIDVMVQRAEQVFGGKVFAVAGGLHLPVTQDRSGLNWLRPQNLLGRPHPLTKPVSAADTEWTIRFLLEHGVQFTALSPHDSCDWTLEQFRQAFGSGYHTLRAGETVVVE